MDTCSGALLFLFFAFLFFQSFSIKTRVMSTLDASFVPKILCIGMMILSAAISVKGFLAVRKGKTEVSVSERADHKPVRVRLVGLSLLFLFLYILLLKPVGFVPMTVLYLFAQMLILAEQKKRYIWLISLLSIAVPLTLYFLFRYAFYVMLPAGILG